MAEMFINGKKIDVVDVQIINLGTDKSLDKIPDVIDFTAEVEPFTMRQYVDFKTRVLKTQELN